MQRLPKCRWQPEGQRFEPAILHCDMVGLHLRYGWPLLHYLTAKPGPLPSCYRIGFFVRDEFVRIGPF